ncbi:MAG: hypothetical protein E6I90_01235 [Chloroflexi bacterium]|nr:MAG: hypothetical protein E6I90_01235 [Chloroflexota bacterium]
MSDTFDKLSVLDSFIEEVNSYLPEIESNLESLAQSPSGTMPGYMDAIEETYRRTHTIGGSASMMDFPGLAHVAHGMEDILGDILDGVSTLDAPTIGLLQRSLGRMHKLLQGIHAGIDEEAVMAEDDADYVRYRALTESSASAPSVANGNTHGAPLLPASIPSPVDMPTQSAPAVSSMPSLDEVLASFRTTPVTAGEDIAWPEEPAPAEPGSADFGHQPEQVAEPAQPETSFVPEPSNPSALEILAATTATWPAYSQNNIENSPAGSPVAPPHDESVSLPASASEDVTDPKQPSLVQSAPAPLPADLALPVEFNEMHEETHSLAVQASSLREMLKQLRVAMSVIEAQRTEFKGFLDGSKDALDRMEDWAGQAMGLNLRNSPEHVRRYLPLSVMWVSNTKLKKVLELLTQITSGVEMTDEQIHIVLQQLFASIESCGNAFQQLQAQSSSHIFTHDQGWTPWEMRVSREAEAMRERVTFERRGDLAALRTEIEAAVREEFRREQEAKIREEVRREYEIRPLTLAARSELERQLRNEIHQEFEAKRQLLERVSGTDNVETIQELENRLRSEIEIACRVSSRATCIIAGRFCSSGTVAYSTCCPEAIDFCFGFYWGLWGGSVRNLPFRGRRASTNDHYARGRSREVSDKS